MTKDFWPLLRTDRKYWRDSGCSLDLLPNHCQFTVNASAHWTAGRLCSKSLESLCSVPTTNTSQQKSHCVRSLGQLVSSSYLFSAFHCILHVLASYLVEKQNSSEQSVGAGNNCRPASWSIGIAVTAMKPQLTSADKCDCVCVTVCVLVLNIAARIVDRVLSWHLCDSRNDHQLRDRWTLNKEALFEYLLAGLGNSAVDELFFFLRNPNKWRNKASTCSTVSQVNSITYIDFRAPPTQRDAR